MLSTHSCHSYLWLFCFSEKLSLLFEVIVMLEKGVACSPSNAQYKLILIKLYILLGRWYHLVQNAVSTFLPIFWCILGYTSYDIDWKTWQAWHLLCKLTSERIKTMALETLWRKAKMSHHGKTNLLQNSGTLLMSVWLWWDIFTFWLPWLSFHPCLWAPAMATGSFSQ